MAKNNITERDFEPLPEMTSENANEVKVCEPLYSIDELAAAARTKFNTAPEVVKTALRMAGRAKATQPETAKIVKAFLEREVK